MPSANKIHNGSQSITYQLLQIQGDMSYIEKLIQILDCKEKHLRNKIIPLIKALWRSQQIKEVTREPEEEIRRN